MSQNIGSPENIGVMAAHFAVEVSKEILNSSKGSFKGNKDKLLNYIKSDMSKYLDKVYAKCSKTKTLLYSDKAVNLSDIYVNGNLSNNGDTIRDTNLLSNVIKSKNDIVISGIAGCGKSMMMKFFAIDIVRNYPQTVPVFFELRNLNKDKKLAFKNHIWKEVVFNKSNFTLKRFEHALKLGMFTFILDGFDEIDEDISNKMDSNIRDFIKLYPKNKFIISSRPDQSLNSSVELDSYHVKPMSKTQVITLISLTKFDEEKKADFIEEIKSDLYDKHQDFLSRPLLATMMLMTYHQFSSVPDKIHLFYGQVFDVLFRRHDSSKDGNYKRDFKTDLAIDDFSKLFSVFSINSYVKNDPYFTEISALELCEKAINNCKLKVDKTDFLSDLLNCVCLLIKDGNRIYFAHRSFQEYFSAIYINSLSDKNYQLLVDKFEPRIERDNTFSLLQALDNSRFERLFIKPRLEALIQALNDGSASQVKNFLDYFFHNIGFLKENNYDTDSHDLIMHEGQTFYKALTKKDYGELAFSTRGNLKFFSFLCDIYPGFFVKLASFELAQTENQPQRSRDTTFDLPSLLFQSIRRSEVTDGIYLDNNFVELLEDLKEVIAFVGNLILNFGNLLNNIEIDEEYIDSSVLNLIDED